MLILVREDRQIEPPTPRANRPAEIQRAGQRPPVKAAPVFKLFFEMSMLAFEAQQAMWLRGMKLALGGAAADREANLMVREKLSAGQNAVFRAATGTAPIAIVKGYRRKVRANVRRLSR